MHFRIAKLARCQGLTTKALAEKAGLKYSVVKNLWQHRTPNPKYETLRAIAVALGMDVQQLEAEPTPQTAYRSNPIPPQHAAD